MERTKKPEVRADGKIRYKKIGGGSLRINRQIIKPGQIFLAYPDDIKEGWKDVVIPLDDLPITDQTPGELMPGKEAEFFLSPRGKSNLWYNVVDSKGKILNDKALKKAVAEQLIEDLVK